MGELAREDLSNEGPPKTVADSVAFLTSHGVWHSVSRNLPAMSCRDAVQKRQRLGKVGIPLRDELKSFVGVFPDESGRSRLAAVHCRAHQQLNFARIARSLGTSDIRRATAEELESMGLSYGIVNPIQAYCLDPGIWKVPIPQLFDRRVMERMGTPGTMMTNAGDHTWAVEFYTDQLVKAMQSDAESKQRGPEVIVGDFALPQDSLNPLVLGLITGNSPESGLLLWQMINESIRTKMGRQFQGDVSMPRVHLESLPEMGLSMELEARESMVRAPLMEAVNELLDDGVTLLAIADNTTQYYAPEVQALCEDKGASYASLTLDVEQHVLALGATSASIIGIPYVSEKGKWSAYHRDFKHVDLVPPTPRAKQLIEQVAYQVKQEGPSESTLNRLRDVLNQEVSEEVVILALTELSILLDFQRKKGRGAKIIIDPMKVYAETIAQRYVDSISLGAGADDEGDPDEAS